MMYILNENPINELENIVQPKIYTKEQHQISLNLIDRNALYVLEKLRSRGHIAYLVGGSVRDLLLKAKPKDFDISTSAKPEEIKTIFQNSILIGKRFRLAHIRFGKKILEVSTFRSGDIDSEELILRDNIWGSPEEDVLRRDFTINGLYYDDSNQTIIDYVDGFTDVKNHFLQTIGNPFLRFKQDPVRMIRLLKFQARLGFISDPQASQALLECRHEILKSSQARIFEELLRMLESGAAHAFICLLADHYILELLLPVLGDFLETPQRAQIFSMLSKIDQIVCSEEEKNPKRSVLLCCLIFPILEQKIHDLLEKQHDSMHLGQIQDASSILVKEVFEVFFHLPRRYKTEVISILTSQFRMTPLSNKKPRNIRIPKVPDFNLALDFLNIRAQLHPPHQNSYNQWAEAFSRQGDLSKTKKQPRRYVGKRYSSKNR